MITISLTREHSIAPQLASLMSAGDIHPLKSYALAFTSGGCFFGDAIYNAIKDTDPAADGRRFAAVKKAKSLSFRLGRHLGSGVIYCDHVEADIPLSDVALEFVGMLLATLANRNQPQPAAPANKWGELDGLDLNGYRAFLREFVVRDGVDCAIYELHRGSALTGYTKVRGFLEELEFLTAHGYTNSNEYPPSDLSLTSSVLKIGEPVFSEWSETLGCDGLVVAPAASSLADKVKDPILLIGPVTVEAIASALSEALGVRIPTESISTNLETGRFCTVEESIGLIAGRKFLVDYPFYIY